MNDNVRKITFYIGLVAIFLIVFFTSFTLTSNAFYQSEKTISGQIILGKANVAFINDSLDVSVKMGSTISYEVSVINANSSNSLDINGLIDCYLRVKVILTSNGQEVDVISPVLASNNWLQHMDGYIYYKPIFSTGTQAKIFSQLVVANEIKREVLENGVNITVIAETVQLGGNLYKTVWTTAPSIW